MFAQETSWMKYTVVGTETQPKVLQRDGSLCSSASPQNVPWENKQRTGSPTRVSLFYFIPRSTENRYISGYTHEDISF
ncbi:MAG: hypothetical protein KME60_13140 [Cyanomargarita calcarea GSE-NOS-MK-12-04C]|jgi:hypothetical protein|uniref:Uncharacterized protein n=1 Tax=Cyanomargarita calcarea GSE-NOS-MK-12-04C TaxID=2839659 RepID=A0A951QPH9_9CYAN|nr:hypothetical protein [Cyanomargarita calcarea GSE-NOS-MK-12-04C]